MQYTSNAAVSRADCLTSENRTVKRHVRRKMTEQEKIDYRKRRLLRACKKCAGSKRKCNHNIAEWKIVTNTKADIAHPATSCQPRRSLGLVEEMSSTTKSCLFRRDDTYLDGAVGNYFSSKDADVYKVLDYAGYLQDDMDLNSHVLDETCLILHKPQSPETLSAILFVENITCEGVADSWFGQIPSRIGHDLCFDLAVAALQMTCWYRRQLPGATLPKVYNALASALEALKSAMRSDGAILGDHTLAAVAALAPVEAIRTGHTFLVPTHLDGLTTILSSRAAIAPLSEIARRILQYHFCDTYVMAAIRGVVSPLEDLDRRYCKPEELTQSAAPESRIRAIGNELCLRLPRLIALVRQACQQKTSAAVVSSALTYADELLQLKDEPVENDYLYLVGVARTSLPSDSRVTEYSLQFKTISSYEAGAYYWHTRATLFKLCCRLRSNFSTMCDIYNLPTLPELETELRRLLSNVLMTTEFARTLKARKRRRLFAQSLLACWSILKGCPGALSGGKDLGQAKAWLLMNFTTSLLGQTATLTEDDMDDAAHLFEGGPLTGAYKDLYDPA